MVFQVSDKYPEAVRAFLEESVEDRKAVLAAAIKSKAEYFGQRADGKTHIECVMNSPDLTSEPTEDCPENEHFKQQVEKLFRNVITAQEEIEKGKKYSSVAIQPSLARQHIHDAWVIGAKLPDRDAEMPILSMGDSLVHQLVGCKKVRHVWSTSRSQQEEAKKHTHFQCDLNTVTRTEFSRQMLEIQEFRQAVGAEYPLVVYYVFGNTGGNYELDPLTGKSKNSPNIDATEEFLHAARTEQWLNDDNVRLVVVSSFHCSPERTLYNDRLQGLPTEDLYGSEDSEAYKKALKTANVSAGLLWYTATKYASAAMFAAALTTDEALSLKLHDQICWVRELHRKIECCPHKDDPRKYHELNDWVLQNLAEEIKQLDSFLDRFFEDTSGSNAHVCGPGLVARLQIV